jgi:hypothetical protein
MSAFRTIRRALTGLLLGLLVAVPARAQSASDALWYSVTVGAGSARFTCDPCAGTRDSGPSARVQIGGFARPGLRVGGSVGVWTHQEGDLRETLQQAGIVAHLDVRPGSALHLIAGLGWIGWRAEPFVYDGVDLSLGAGWNLPLSGRWSLSNAVTVHSASYGRLRNGDDTVKDVSLSLAGLEIGLIRR